MTRERARVALAGRAFHYRDTGSALHALAPGIKLAAVAALGAAGVALRSPVALALLLGVVMAGYAVAGLRAVELWQDARWLALQGAVVLLLYLLRDGPAGAAPGGRIALQLALVFLPGALLLRTTGSARLLEGLRRRLPERLAFGLATSLRLLPAFTREMNEIWMAQRLRGARLAPRQLWHPSAWRDAVACLGLPLAVRAIRLADEAALAAEVRGLPPREEDAS